jgi:hypothetical protein
MPVLRKLRGLGIHASQPPGPIREWVSMCPSLLHLHETDCFCTSDSSACRREVVVTKHLNILSLEQLST